MDCRTTLNVLLLSALWLVATTNPSPQFYPPTYLHHQTHNSPPRDSTYSGSQPWGQTLQNFSSPNPSFLDPATFPAMDDVRKNEVPRQLYGAPSPQYGAPPPPQASGYPQIYKIDNLIIIANPPQPQACVQPSLKPLDPAQFPGGEDGVNNRFGEGEDSEPSKCTWAIVACCAPGNTNVRYNCFELLGCPGFFFDNSPCSPAIVMAATRSALAFYSNTNNTGVDNNRV